MNDFTERIHTLQKKYKNFYQMLQATVLLLSYINLELCDLATEMNLEASKPAESRPAER